MKIIRPATLSVAEVTSTNVVETAPADWSSTATFAAGAQVATWAGTVATVWTSLAGSNTGNAPATSPTWWERSGSTYREYDAGAVYALGDRVLDPSNRRIYESAADANTAHALTDAAWWLDAGPSNRWAMFDAVNGSATTNPETINVTLNPTGVIDGVALIGVQASSARIIVTSATDGVVYDRTVYLTETDAITDWYAYYFEEVTRKTNIAVTDLPPYYAPTIQVILDYGTNDASIATLVAGQQRYFGETDFGASFGIQDYSKKSADEFGNYTLIQRQFADLANLTVYIESNKVDEIKRLLSSYRATPIVYIGTESYGASLIFGFFRNFQVEIAFSTVSICTLQIEGLN